MKVLLVHNHYQQPGGEDQVFTDETALLRAQDHKVFCYTASNDRIEGMSPLALAGATLWHQPIWRELRTLVRRERPHVAHFHNTFPLISPAAYYAVKAEGLPVVQTLHNYRLLCPNALFFREGRICEDCLGKFVPWPGLIHTCYRRSRAASGATVTMLGVHRALGTWTRTVDMYVALTEFARRKFIQGGLPAEKIMVKSNFVYPDPGPGEGRGGYVLYVGRLSPEKGIDTMLAAWERLGAKVPLRIVGDGPLAPRVAEAARRVPGVEWLGRMPVREVYDLMGAATTLIFPSEWYETFGRVAIEAYAKGTPVIASQLGAVAEVVDDGRTGLYFRPGDPEDLAAKMEWALTHPKELGRMRREARTEFELKYTAQRNYHRLMEIYQLAAHGA